MIRSISLLSIAVLAISTLAKAETADLDYNEPSPEEIAADLNAMDPRDFDYVLEETQGNAWLPNESLSESAREATDPSPANTAQIMVVVHKNIKKGEKQYLEAFRDGNDSPFLQALTSTGVPGHSTPEGKFKVLKLVKDYHSQKYDAPMPWSVFFKEGYAVHGTVPSNYPKLGQPASHGCVRLHQDNAQYLYNTVKDLGPRNTLIVII
jgi:hypothetical protein